MNGLIEYSPQAIANIKTVEEAKDGYEKLKALASYFKDDYEQAFSFAVAMCECFCRMGELIEKMQERGELAMRGGISGKHTNVMSHDIGINVMSHDIYTLSELGITRNESSYSQKAKVKI